MNTKILLLFILILLNINLSAQTPDCIWAKSSSGNGYNEMKASCTSDGGNSYVTGIFLGTTFTLSNITLTNTDTSGQTGDIFLAKYDVAGNVTWAKNIFGKRDDNSSSIVIDANENIYLTGIFYSDTIFFDSTFIVKKGISYSDLFIAKFDSSGNLLWVKSGGGSGSDESFLIAVDSQRNSWISGIYDSDTLQMDSITLINPGGSNIFLAKFNTTGNIIWIKSAHQNQFGMSMGLSADQHGNAYLTGFFGDATIGFDSITVINAHPITDDCFIFRFDPDGRTTFSKSLGGSQNDHGTAIISDHIGNMYVSIASQGPTTMLDSIVVSNSGDFDILIAKFDSTGHAQWARSAGSGMIEYATYIALDPQDNIYIAGPFNGSSLTIGNTTLSNAGSGGWDIFLAKYDISGNSIWAKSIGGTGNDYCSGLWTDDYGSTFISGTFESSSIAFDNIALLNTSGSQVFIAKLDFATSTEKKYFPYSLNIFPNPTNGRSVITSTEMIREIEITDMAGRIILFAKPDDYNYPVSLDMDQMYLVSIVFDKGRITNKLLVIH